MGMEDEWGWGGATILWLYIVWDHYVVCMTRATPGTIDNLHI